jgi:tRNA(Ile)-lysidine synthase
LADLGSIQNPLTVRNWRPGDRFESSTGTGAKKVKALLLERRIPAEQRRLWPVVLSGERIVWVRGFSVARSFRAGPSSAVGLLIREEVLSNGEAPNPPE